MPVKQGHHDLSYQAASSHESKSGGERGKVLLETLLAVQDLAECGREVFFIQSSTNETMKCPSR